MFKLNLVPQAANQDTKISAAGFVLTVDGQDADFSILEDGQQVELEAPLIGTARRVGDVISLSVLLQYDSATAEPMQSTDPADYVIELSDGDAPDVIKRKPAPEALPDDQD